jgi:hypothetical protein
MMLKLIHKIAAEENRVRRGQILAPCVSGGKIRARVGGMVCELAVDGPDFEGWGVFRAQSLKTASLESEASLSQVSRYLHLLRSVRLILVQPLRGRSWLALPANRSEARQKSGQSGPVAVHLVTQGRAFEQVIARSDGSNYWFEKVDRSADPLRPGYAARALRAFTAPESLSLPGLTPEFREAYRMVFSPAQSQSPAAQVRCSESRLRRALEQGGGILRSFVDQGNYWTTHWSTRDGQEHTSAIMKSDLTVLSAGICLSGEDQKFDLQSLVGVVERLDD